MNKSVYVRPNKPAHIVVHRRDIDITSARPTLAGPVCVHASTECHVTPGHVAEKMAYFLGPVDTLLEPSAGTGNLMLAAQARQIVAVERNQALCDEAAARTKIRPLCEDFLAWWPGCFFDGVLMNPPFRQVRAHIGHAFELLAGGGSLVALVPVTFDAGRIGGHDIEILPRDTFLTNHVQTKIIIAHNE